MQDTPTPLRTLLTLAACALIVLVAVLWGWRALTAPLPAPAEAAACQDVELAAGDRVFPADVVVTVLNASTRSGLASRTLAALGDQGFVSAGEDNAPRDARVRVAQIWTDEPGSPAVRLVRSWLPQARIVERTVDEPGVVVVVGQDFTEVRGGRKSVKAKNPTVICSPPDPVG